MTSLVTLTSNMCKTRPISLTETFLHNQSEKSRSVLIGCSYFLNQNANIRETLQYSHKSEVKRRINKTFLFFCESHKINSFVGISIMEEFSFFETGFIHDRHAREIALKGNRGNNQLRLYEKAP